MIRIIHLSLLVLWSANIFAIGPTGHRKLVNDLQGDGNFYRLQLIAGDYIDRPQPTDMLLQELSFPNGEEHLNREEHLNLGVTWTYHAGSSSSDSWKWDVIEKHLTSPGYWQASIAGSPENQEMLARLVEGLNCPGSADFESFVMRFEQPLSEKEGTTFSFTVHLSKKLEEDGSVVLVGRIQSAVKLEVDSPLNYEESTPREAESLHQTAPVGGTDAQAQVDGHEVLPFFHRVPVTRRSNSGPNPATSTGPADSTSGKRRYSDPASDRRRFFSDSFASVLHALHLKKKKSVFSAGDRS